MSLGTNRCETIISLGTNHFSTLKKKTIKYLETLWCDLNKIIK